MVDRNRGREAADHRCDLRPPHPARIDDALGLDRPLGRRDRPHLPPRAELDPRHAPARDHPHAQLPGGRSERVRRNVGVDVAVVRNPERAVERLTRCRRQQLEDVRRAEQRDVEADPTRPARTALELEEAVGARGDPQAADSLEDAELAVQLDAVAAEPHHRRRGIELRDEPGGVVRRSARQLPLFHEHDVVPTGPGEVVGDARARDSSADHDDLRPLHCDRNPTERRWTERP